MGAAPRWRSEGLERRPDGPGRGATRRGMVLCMASIVERERRSLLVLRLAGTGAAAPGNWLDAQGVIRVIIWMDAGGPCIVENAMPKTITAIVAAAGIAAATLVAPKPAEARCIGCWVGAGIAAAVIGGAIASSAYGYGPYGYGVYGYGGGYGYGDARSSGYAYAPAYSYGYSPGYAYYGGGYASPYSGYAYAPRRAYRRYYRY